MTPTPQNSPRIAVLIPCYQEEQTIAKVVADFRRELPEAVIHVFDNNCTDRTAELAAAAGAVVTREKRQGKGFVVAAMFEVVDADIFVMVDGDDTYEASEVHKLLKPVLDGDADMTVGGRQTIYERASFRPLHRFGNAFVCWLINKMFRSDVRDIFSGFRVFTRQAVLNIPITAHGFDVETELTLQALYRGMVIREFETPYRARPEGSFSKLNTFSDGFRVLLRLFLICKSYKPLTLFGLVAVVLGLLSLAAGVRPVWEYASAGYVYAVPSAILAAALGSMAVLSLALGLLLNSMNLRLLELERLLVKRVEKLSRD